MDYHSTPSSVSKNDRTHFTFQGIEYEIDPDTGGVLIPLGGKKHTGHFALVDADDLPRVAGHSWSAHMRHTRGVRRRWYAKTHIRGNQPEYPSMHRWILDLKDPRVLVDHINHNGLDNRRCNIRCGTSQMNNFNRRPNLYATSRYKGVHWVAREAVYRSVIEFNGRSHFLGSFADEIDAARAYDAKAVEFFGDYAWLNFPEEHGREVQL